jgi:hypothetical protein
LQPCRRILGLHPVQRKETKNNLHSILIEELANKQASTTVLFDCGQISKPQDFFKLKAFRLLG